MSFPGVAWLTCRRWDLNPSCPVLALAHTLFGFFSFVWNVSDLKRVCVKNHEHTQQHTFPSSRRTASCRDTHSELLRHDACFQHQCSVSRDKLVPRWTGQWGRVLPLLKLHQVLALGGRRELQGKVGNRPRCMHPSLTPEWQHYTCQTSQHPRDSV